MDQPKQSLMSAEEGTPPEQAGPKKAETEQAESAANTLSVLEAMKLGGLRRWFDGECRRTTRCNAEGRPQVDESVAHWPNAARDPHLWESIEGAADPSLMGSDGKVTDDMKDNVATHINTCIEIIRDKGGDAAANAALASLIECNGELPTLHTWQSSWGDSGMTLLIESAVAAVNLSAEIGTHDWPGSPSAAPRQEHTFWAEKCKNCGLQRWNRMPGSSKLACDFL